MTVEQTATPDQKPQFPSSECEEAYAELQKICHVLTQNGYTLLPFVAAFSDPDHFVEAWNNEKDSFFSMGNPLVHEKGNGIRVIYKEDYKTEKKRWLVWYTNGLEDTKNEKRMEIAGLLRAQGIDTM